MVSGLKCKSLTHSEFIVVYPVRSWFNCFSHVSVLFSQHLSSKQLSLPSLYNVHCTFLSPSSDRRAIWAWVYFWPILFHWDILGYLGYFSTVRYRRIDVDIDICISPAVSNIRASTLVHNSLPPGASARLRDMVLHWYAFEQRKNYSPQSFLKCGSFAKDLKTTQKKNATLSSFVVLYFSFFPIFFLALQNIQFSLSSADQLRPLQGHWVSRNPEWIY